MKKTPTTGGKTSVTFDLPPIEAETVVVCGDFNAWASDTHPLKRRKDGSFATSVRLAPGTYRFRYLIDGRHWENDWSADAYAPNDHGSDDSVVIVEGDPAPAKAPAKAAATVTGKKAPKTAKVSAAGAKVAKSAAAPAKPTKKAGKKATKSSKATPSARKAPKS